MALITQIYEIQTPEDVEPLCAMGVDHIGSVLLSGDEWQQPVIRETVHRVQACGRKSALIPLYNDPPTVFRTLDYYRPDIVHFCDMLPLSSTGRGTCQPLIKLQRDIRARYPGIAIMRSIPIGRFRSDTAASTLALAETFEPFSDLLLTDTVLTWGAQEASQPVEGFVGITGKTCHWETARVLAATSSIPVILAGGLSPENVYEAVRSVAPAGVDSCTCTNRLDAHGKPVRFRKDLTRVGRFVAEARRAAATLAPPCGPDPRRPEHRDAPYS